MSPCRYYPKRRTAFQKHKGLISSVGVLIVLLTFLIKEGRVEKLKDQTSAIDSAEKTFALRTDNSRTEADVKSLKKMFEDRLAPAVYSGMGSDASRDQAAFILSRQAIRDAIDRIRDSTSNLTDFLRDTPPNANLDKKLGEVNHDVGVYENALARITRERDMKQTDDPKIKHPLDGNAQDIAHVNELSIQVDLDGISKGLEYQEVKATTLRNSALDASKRYKEEIERKRQQYQTIADVVYVIGLGFGLVVGLFGGDEPLPEG